MTSTQYTAETRDQFGQALRDGVLARYGKTLEELMDIQIAEWREDLDPSDWQSWTASTEAAALIKMRWDTQDSVQDTIDDLGCYV